MRFYDQAKIQLVAGHGGAGCVSFRREKFIPRGGPDGGDGGKGGDIIIVSNSQRNTLQDFRYIRIYKADRGEHGSGNNRAGKDGLSRTIEVPTGTIIKDELTGEILKDFSQDKEVWIACKGGRGGKGNSHFVSSTFQAPKFAQPGEEGEIKSVVLELKLLADVGLIGFPNAGKSSLIRTISAARPKVADYPFTTLEPALGVVDLGENLRLVAVDVPGLIEGAHLGHGLGLRFLRHIERTRAVIHVLDASTILEEVEKGDWNGAVQLLKDRYLAIRTELKAYDSKLLEKPEITVINKCDLFDPEKMEKLKSAIHGNLWLRNTPIWISTLDRTGIATLTQKLRDEFLPLQGPDAEVLLPHEVNV